MCVCVGRCMCARVCACMRACTVVCVCGIKSTMQNSVVVPDHILLLSKLWWSAPLCPSHVLYHTLHRSPSPRLTKVGATNSPMIKYNNADNQTSRQNAFPKVTCYDVSEYVDCCDLSSVEHQCLLPKTIDIDDKTQTHTQIIMGVIVEVIEE